MTKRFLNLNKNLLSYIESQCGSIKRIVANDTIYNRDSFITDFDYTKCKLIFIRTENDLYILTRTEIRLYEQSKCSYSAKIKLIKREVLL